MPLPAAPSDLRSSCAGIFNTGRLFQPRLWMGVMPAPVAIGNRTDDGIDSGAGTGPTRAATVDRLLRTVGAELIEWGTALGAARAAQAAERLVPGVSLPYAVYTLYAALSHAARGRLLAAVHSLPLSPLASGPALRLLMAALGPQACAALRALPDHAAAVFGLATCALLHHLACPAPPQNEPARGNVPSTVAVVLWLRRLRGALDTLAGLRVVLNEDAPRQAHRAAAGSRVPWVHHNASVARQDDPLAVAFPAAAAAMRAHPQACAPAPSILPMGACAGGRGRARGNAHPPRQVKPPANPRVPRRHPFSHRGGARRVTITRLASPDTGLPQFPSPLEGPPARGGSSGGGTSFQKAAKESTAVARSQPGKAGAGAGGVRRTEGRGRPRADPDVAVAGSGSDSASRTVSSARSQDPVPDLPARPVHPCLHFPTPHRAARQVLHAQADAAGVTYCVAPDDVPALQQAVSVGVPAAGDAVFWTRAHAVPQSLPKQGPVRVTRHVTVQDLQREIPRVTATTALAGDQAWSVLTVSVRPDHPLRHAPVSRAPLLQANTFRFIGVPQWDGSNRTFLAYFLNDAGAVCRGFNVGWLEVEVDARGRPALSDTQSGYRLASATFEGLAWGVERISGSRPLYDDENASRLLHVAQNLQVAERDTWCGRRTHDVQVWNPGLALLPVESLRVPGTEGRTLMFKGSFTLAASTLLYKDIDGRVGQVRLEATEDGQHAYFLHAELGNRDRFLLDKGLRMGVRYEALDLVELLEAQELVFIPPPPVRPAGVDGRGQNSGSAT